MRGYREPGFQDRVAAAEDAKTKALEKLKAKPPVDEAEQAEKLANRLAKEAAARERREAKLREREEAEAARKAEREAAAEAALPPPAMTEAERKAARDARYAARKARK
ncbi:DUF6481 family protein [Sphingomonas sp. HH69]